MPSLPDTSPLSDVPVPAAWISLLGVPAWRSARGEGLLPDPRAAAHVLPRAMVETTERIVAIGTSTGGTQALELLLAKLPVTSPGIVVVQHMPETFTASFAKRLDSLCAPRVIESKGNEKVEAGTVYIAPGHSHLQVRKTASGLVTELLQTPPVNRHRPAVGMKERPLAHRPVVGQRPQPRRFGHRERFGQCRGQRQIGRVRPDPPAQAQQGQQQHQCHGRPHQHVGRVADQPVGATGQAQQGDQHQRSADVQFKATGGRG